jgi:hypothetical protein
MSVWWKCVFDGRREHEGGGGVWIFRLGVAGCWSKMSLDNLRDDINHA